MKEVRVFDTTSFTKIVLSDSDSLSGASLTQIQKDVIQNKRADIAEEIINLTYSENKDEQYALQLAYLQGQLHFATYLIAESDIATNFIVSESNK